MNGQEISARGARGERIVDDDFLLFFNAHYEMIEFTLPTQLQEEEWVVVIDTKEPRFVKEKNVFTGEQAVPVTGHSIGVLSCRR